VGAGLTQPHTSKNNITDAKFLFDKMIERNPAGHNSAPRLGWIQLNVVVSLETFDGFNLYKSHIAPGSRLI
jgi:hypothetical protein